MEAEAEAILFHFVWKRKRLKKNFENWKRKRLKKILFLKRKRKLWKIFQLNGSGSAIKIYRFQNAGGGGGGGGGGSGVVIIVLIVVDISRCVHHSYSHYPITCLLQQFSFDDIASELGRIQLSVDPGSDHRHDIVDIPQPICIAQQINQKVFQICLKIYEWESMIK